MEDADAAAAAPVSGEKKRTVALKEHWSGPSVSIGADVRFLLRIVVTLLLIWRVAVTVILAIKGRYDFTMYTYWSHTILVLFYALLWIALWTERWLLTFVTLLIFPIALGSTFLVMVSIVIIIQENAAVLTASLSTTLTLSLIHTGDWILHSLPVLEILLILCVGYLLYTRTIIAGEVAGMRKSEWKAIYVLYFIVSPMIPMLIYSLIFDPATHYPTGIPTYVLWLGLVAIDILWMMLMYFCFTASANVMITVYGWFSCGPPLSPPSDAETPDQQMSSASPPTDYSDRDQFAHFNTRDGPPSMIRQRGGAPADMVIRIPPIQEVDLTVPSNTAYVSSHLRASAPMPPSQQQHQSTGRTARLRQIRPGQIMNE